jgi:hypothetical protein
VEMTMRAMLAMGDNLFNETMKLSTRFVNRSKKKKKKKKGATVGLATRRIDVDEMTP